MNSYFKILFSSAFICFIFIPSGLSFSPDRYVPQKDPRFVLFLEGNSLKSFTKRLKAFYFHLRKKQKNKQIEWNFITQRLVSGFGVNIFDARLLKKTGVNTKARFGVILYASRKKINLVHFLIPATNSQKLYRWIKKSMERKIQKNNVRKGDRVRELIPKKLLEIQLRKRKFYLARSEKHISFSNQKKSTLNGIQPMPKALKDSGAYKMLQIKIPFKKDTLFRFIATTKIFPLIRNISFLPFFKSNNFKTKAILNDTEFIGGEMKANSKQLSFWMEHTLKKSFFKKNDTKKANKKILGFELDFLSEKDGDGTLPFTNLGLDQHHGNKMLHISYLFNPKDILTGKKHFPFLSLVNLLPKLILRRKAGELKRIFENQLRGNISFILIQPKPNELSFQLNDIDFMASLGLKKKDNKTFKESLKKFLKKNLQPYQLKFSKEKFKKKYDLWDVRWNEKIKNRNLIRILYVLFHKNTLSFFSQKENAEKFLNGSQNDIFKRNKSILSANAKENSGLILFHVDEIYRFIQKSPIGALFPQYVGYIKQIQNLVIHSFQKENSLFTEFKIILH